MLFPEQYRLQLHSDCLHSFWKTWEKVSMAAMTLKSKLGSPLLVTAHSFLTPQLHGLPSVHTPKALSNWRHRMKPRGADNPKCICKAGAGTYQEQAGLRALSQQGSCSELRYIAWESLQMACIAKRFPQHLYLETNHRSFLITKASTIIIHPNQRPLYTQIIFSFKSLFAKRNQSILHFSSD